MADEILTTEEQELFQLSNSLLLIFLEENCERVDGAITRSKVLFDSYKRWCKAHGYFTGSARRFTSNMTAHSEWHDGKTVYNGYPCYRGIQLKGTV